MLRKFADRIDDMIVAKKEKDSSPIKVDLTWPKIELSGDIELQEVETSHQVELGGSVSLNMSPLIEADMTLDIVHWLIKCAPPGYSQFLEEVRERAAKGIGSKNINANAVVALDLTISGGLGGKLAWKKPANKPWRGDATGKAALSFKLKAEVSADATIFYVKIQIGMTATLASDAGDAEGVGATFNLNAVVAQGKPALDGFIEFTGAAIYYTYYAEVSRRGRGSEGGSGSDMARSGGPVSSKQTANTKFKEKRDHKVPILSAARFPKDPRRYALNELDF